MSSPVCEANRGSGEPASRRGWPPKAKRLFRELVKAATLILFEPLRLRHLPYPCYRAAEEDIAAFPNLAIQLPYLLRICRTFIETHLIHTGVDIATLRRSNFWQATHYSACP